MRPDSEMKIKQRFPAKLVYSSSKEGTYNCAPGVSVQQGLRFKSLKQIVLIHIMQNLTRHLDFRLKKMHSE